MEPHLPGMAAGTEPRYWDSMTWINKVNQCVAAGNLEMLRGGCSQGGGEWGEPRGSIAWGLSGRMGSMGLGWTGMCGAS